MKKGIRLLLYILLLLLVYGSYSITPIFITKNKIGHSADIKIIANRGASGVAPENTLPAIKEAIEQGVDRVKIDIRQTADTAIVLMCDKSVERTTNGKGLVHELTLNEIKKLDAGKWFNEQYADTKVPTLQQVMEIAKDKCELILEIQEGNELYPDLEENLVKIINNSGMKNRIIVQSSFDDVIFSIHKLDPNIRIHKVLIADTPFFYYDAKGFHFSSLDKYKFVEEFTINNNFASYRLIDKVKKMGKKLNVQTVNTKKSGSKFIKINIDGIVTDYPNLFSKHISN